MHFITSFFKNLNNHTPSHENTNKDMIKTYSTEEIAIYFNISKKTVEDILLELQWIQEDKVPTEEGIKYGAIVKDENNLLWQDCIISNEIFITKINTKINTLIFALSNNIKSKKETPSEYAYIA